jgi:hypothetical protein
MFVNTYVRKWVVNFLTSKSQNKIPLNGTCCITLNPSLLTVSFGCLTPRGGFVGGATADMFSTCLTFAGYDNFKNHQPAPCFPPSFSQPVLPTTHHFAVLAANHVSRANTDYKSLTSTSEPWSTPTAPWYSYTLILIYGLCLSLKLL